ncbi:MAG TPA: site-specific integrase [Polyangia bacterium]|nr:site-specific integrase [Polyangia bacterium]
MARRPEGWKRYRNTPDGNWIVRFTHGGRRYNISTGKSDPGEASVTAAIIYTQVTSGRWKKRQSIAARRSPRPLDELAAEWLADIEATLDSTTIAQYGIYVTAHWTPFFTSLSTITSETVEDYTRHRLRRVRRKTVLKELSALRGFLNWCKTKDLVGELPVIESPPKTSVGTPDTSRPHKNRFLVLTKDEINAVIAHLPEWRSAPRAPRKYPVRSRFVVAWETALRPETLDKLCAPEDYTRGAGSLVLRDEIDKARFGRRLPLTKHARVALDAVCPEIGLIFGRHDHRNVLRAAARAAELPPEKADRISPYDFRHSRLTYLAENSTNLAGIAYLAGHKNVSTTNKYIRPTERAAELVLDAVKGDSGQILARKRKPKDGGEPRKK